MLNNIKLLINKVIERLFPKISESRYYTNLFTRDINWSSPDPNQEETLRWNIIQNFINSIIAQDPENRAGDYKILDIGCGRGWLSNLLSKYGLVTGIEPVEPVVNYAKQLFPKLNLRKGVAGDLLKEGQAGMYNIVVCSEVIEHIPHRKKSKFLNQLNLLLKEHGFLIITTPRKEAETTWRSYGSADQPVEDWLTEDELHQLLSANQLKKYALSRFSFAPNPNAPEIEIYQLWLAQKVKKS